MNGGTADDGRKGRKWRRFNPADERLPPPELVSHWRNASSLVHTTCKGHSGQYCLHHVVQYKFKNIPPKLWWTSTRLHSVTSQKIIPSITHYFIILGGWRRSDTIIKNRSDLWDIRPQWRTLQTEILLHYNAALLFTCTKKKHSGTLVRKRTIPTERPPLVDEVSANFSG
jgi:hypothetical protein